MTLSMLGLSEVVVMMFLILMKGEGLSFLITKEIKPSFPIKKEVNSFLQIFMI